MQAELNKHKYNMKMVANMKDVQDRHTTANIYNS